MHLDPKIVNLVVGAVVVAWLSITIAGVFLPNVEMPAGLNTIFLGIAGTAVAASKLGGKKDDTKGEGE